ncbi:hypothetical protein [Streptomyces sp. H27-H1]|uniref:hypothetical protein n=1 Tax=Streptomyces sp. H27-H1 TaxID=2996461 RepID=UPI002D1E4361|nr:hypothetical protein [Streptomyces sp. H27-H1]
MGAAGAAALLAAGLAAPAHAAQETAAAATIALSAGHLSGAVGATGDPGATVDIAQQGTPAAFLKVDAQSSSNPAVAGPGDVRIDRTGHGDRELTVRPRGRGYTDLTEADIEAAARVGDTVYLGFRAPLAAAVPGGKALVVPVTNIDQVVAGVANPFRRAARDEPRRAGGS